MPQFPIEDYDDERVGSKKYMKTKAVLCQDGTMHINAYSKTKARTKGLRGRLYIELYDSQNRVIWATKEFHCRTRCSTWDPSCPSSGTDIFSIKVPLPIAQCTACIEIQQDDCGISKALLQQLLHLIKCNLDRYDDLRSFKDQIGVCEGSIGT